MTSTERRVSQRESMYGNLAFCDAVVRIVLADDSSNNKQVRKETVQPVSFYVCPYILPLKT
jgi:hypothetical protein